VRSRIDEDAIASPVRIVRGVQGLMNVADEMDQECQTAGSAPSVVVPFLEASRVFIDFAGDADTTGASPRNVRSTVLQTKC
jgi:hypothetical protein